MKRQFTKYPSSYVKASSVLSEEDVYQIGLKLKSRLFHAGVFDDAYYLASTYSASAYNGNGHNVVSFYFEDYEELRKAKRILDSQPEVLKVYTEECGDNCYYLNCWVL